MVNYILARDDVDYPEEREEEVVDEETGDVRKRTILHMPPIDGERDPYARRKVVLYVEFTKTLAHLQKVS